MKVHVLLLTAFLIASGCGQSPVVSTPPPTPPPLPFVKSEGILNQVQDDNTLVRDDKPIPPEVELQQSVPRKVLLDVPFVIQAPFSRWEPPYKEACEEASLILASKYFTKGPLDKNIMNVELLNVVSWEVAEFGFYEDTTAEQTADIARRYFYLDAETTTDVTADRIKRELAAGHLVIPPLAGRELVNPYFRQPGPIYHMLVIRGYDDRTKEFITNDVGIGRGKEFRYTYEDLLDAVHDWNPDDILKGKKVMIVVKGYAGPPERN